MLMPESIMTSPYEAHKDWGFNNVKHWNIKFCWLPKRCFLSNKILWWKLAYYGQSCLNVNSLQDPAIENYWVEKNEFLIWLLKG